MAKRDNGIMIYPSNGLLAQIENTADSDGMSRSAFVVRVLDEYFGNSVDGVAALEKRLKRVEQLLEQAGASL